MLSGSYLIITAYCEWCKIERVCFQKHHAIDEKLPDTAHFLNYVQLTRVFLWSSKNETKSSFPPPTVARYRRSAGAARKMRFRFTTDQINVMFCSSSLLPIISEFFLQMSITCFRFSEWFIITVIRRLFFSRLWKILRIQLNVVVPETQVGFKFDGYFINWVREMDCLSS